jgi:hypothetical protein
MCFMCMYVLTLTWYRTEVESRDKVRVLGTWLIEDTMPLPVAPV